jgi:hypothetical protein
MTSVFWFFWELPSFQRQPPERMLRMLYLATPR